MARQCKDSDFIPGKWIHYWGQIRQILFTTETEVYLHYPEYIGGKLAVSKNNPFLLTFEPLDDQGQIDDLYG
ncbi:MAG: hypothetical protein V7K67_11125 [Nostoc sp.]|uniref:hypothetical protein n=1 Tax=Nostoc sp. TaxID=1180 RepID=UPI002FFA03B8